MTDKDLEALGRIGSALLEYAGSSREAIRQRFQEKISASLRELGVEVESSSFGRGPNMIGIWTVSVVTPASIKRERIHIPATLEPYSEAAFQTVLIHFQNEVVR